MSKNRDFFYLQYNQIDWKNQEKTKINQYINNYIIENILVKKGGDSLSIFDIGLGIGFFLRMVYNSTKGKYKSLILAGCEPSTANYQYFLKSKPQKVRQGIKFLTHEQRFLDVKTEDLTFDFVTAIYVFPNFIFDELLVVVKKINSMLKDGGKFVLVLANEEYLKRKLESERDLLIEEGEVSLNGEMYKEVLHYADIPKIGKVIDYNREERFYLDLFLNNNFRLFQKENINDNGFICTLFVFEKV